MEHDDSDSSEKSVPTGSAKSFLCDECGSGMIFDAVRQQLFCQSCGVTKEVDVPDSFEIHENDFEAMLAKDVEIGHVGTALVSQHQEVSCQSCGANVLFEGTLTSLHCPYCGGNLVLENVHRGGFRIAVDGLLAFVVPEITAKKGLEQWIKSRWFAPNDFRKMSTSEYFHGVYIPYWTFDAETFTQYQGEKGVTRTSGSGKNRRRYTQWRPASGSFHRSYDDVLQPGTHELSNGKLIEIGPWPLKTLKPYSEGFLAGFFARTYDMELKDAFTAAKKRIEDDLMDLTKQKIGGDKQRVHKFAVAVDQVTFKHVLLPVWLIAYQYKNKSYRVFINAVTGKPAGDRPYSWVKISAAVLAALALVLAIVVAFNLTK